MKVTPKKKNVKDRQKISPAQRRPVQIAKKSQLLTEDLEDVTPIVQFLEDFRAMVDPRSQNKSILISIKIPEPLLSSFKFKASLEKTPYQTMIKKLMAEWVAKS